VARHILLLRGINIGARNRIAMPELRRVLTEAGFEDVRTYLQSGNVVLSSTAKPDVVARRCEQLIERTFGLDVDVIVRTKAELVRVVERNPLGEIATDPKRYQVSFLATKPKADVVKRLEAAARAPEQFVAVGREIYAWHPDTIARSKLWALLGGRQLGVTATSRNWSTVTKLLAVAKS
jgi:uncharacterized protein (DUF1697 family)